MSDGSSETGSDVLSTRLVGLLGCRYPIVQTGMGWVSGASLTAATSAAGGFGILASITMTDEQFRDAVRSVKEQTDAPFVVSHVSWGANTALFDELVTADEPAAPEFDHPERTLEAVSDRWVAPAVIGVDKKLTL